MAHAQSGGYIHYDPLPSTPPQQQQTYSQPQQQQYGYQQQQTAQPQIQLTNGYIFNANGVRKVSLRITYVDRTVYIMGVKELSAEYWTDLSRTGATGSRLMYNEDHSDRFEYKVYIPVLGEVVYF